MSYTLGKNIKLDRKNNKIVGDFASSNLYDDYGKHIYTREEYLPNDKYDFNDKLGLFFYFILLGDLQCKKYSDLINARDDFKDYTDRIDNAYYQNTEKIGDIYLEYEDTFKQYLVKNCVLKDFRGMYIQRINKRTYRAVYDITKAKKFNSNALKNNSLVTDNNWKIELV